jgi:predicted negative regulator of RcsB-dependent stress response
MKNAFIVITILLLALAITGFVIYKKKQKAQSSQGKSAGTDNSIDRLPAKDPKINSAFQKFINDSNPAGASEGDKPSSRSK